MVKGSVQKRIRGLERALRKKSSDDPTTTKLMEAIESLKQEKEQNIVKIKEKKNAQKYHMVKFFERKKITRSIRKLEKKISGKSSQCKNIEELNKQKRALEEDLAYIMYFPNTLKYVSLFANKSADNDNQKTLAQMKKAKTMALQAWAQSKEEGKEDRVAYAMEVERNGNRDIRIDSTAALKTSAENCEQETRESNSDNAQSSSSEDDSENESDDSESDEEVSRRESSDPKPPVSSTEPIISQKDMSTPLELSQSDLEVNVVYQPDPFFLEEDDGTGVIESFETHEKNKKYWNKNGEKQTKGGKRSGIQQLNTVRGRSDGKALSKQEARLANWQNKQRQKKDNRYGYTDADSSIVKRDMPSKSHLKESKKRKALSENGEANGRYRNDKREKTSGFVKKNASIGGGLRNTNNKTQSTPKAAWEEGGGVSATCVTALTQSKLSGGIVAGSSNKKIKFD